MRVRVRASVTVSVRDVTIIFIGLSVYITTYTYYIWTHDGYYYIILYSRTSTTLSPPYSRFPLQDIVVVILLQYYMGQSHINEHTHTHTHTHIWTVKFPARRSYNLRQAYTAILESYPFLIIVAKRHTSESNLFSRKHLYNITQVTQSPKTYIQSVSP